MEQAGQSALPVFAAGAASCVREDIPGERRGAVLIYTSISVIYQIFSESAEKCGKNRCIKYWGIRQPADDSGVAAFLYKT